MNFKQVAAFIDCESTCADPATARVIELTITKVYPDGERTSNTHRINPEEHIPQAATDIHGISDADVRNSPKFRQLSRGIIEFLQDVEILVAYNAPYDIHLLMCEFEHCDIIWDYKRYLIIDPCAIFKRKESRTLSAAVKFFLGREHDGAHGSFDDVDATIDVLNAQIDRYSEFKEMTAEQLALYSNNDRKMLDITGKFKYNDEGNIIFNFGKHKDEVAGKIKYSDKKYLEWMVAKTSNFHPSVKEIATKVLLGHIY